MPRVSVILPVYNGERFLRSAVESILGQTLTDLELIIVDDGSTDRTGHLIAGFDDPRIRAVRNERNQGIVRSLNRGIGNARASYIARMDADDVSVPSRLERQADFLDDHEEIALVGTDVLLIDEAGTVVGSRTYPHSPRAIRKKLFVHNPFAHGSVVLRKTVLERLGLYDPRFTHNEDYDLWLRIGAQYEMANLPEPLLMRRVHEENITRLREKELVRNRVRTLSHAVHHYYRNPFYAVYLIRPFVAYVYRLVGGRNAA